MTLCAQLFEDFETGSKGTYDAATIELATGYWLLDNALIGSSDGDKTMGSQSVRLRDGFLSMDFDLPGAGDVRFYHANAGFASDVGGRLQLQYSLDEGINWKNAGSEITSPEYGMETAVTNIQIDEDIRFRVKRTAGNRINIDNFEVTRFLYETPDPRLLVTVDEWSVMNYNLVDFGNQLIGRNSKKPLSISNSGNQHLDILALIVSGDGFHLQGSTPGTIAPGDSANIKLFFEPPGDDIYTGQLIVITNDPELSHYEVVLTGKGIDPGDPISIKEARGLPPGTLVTVSGWITASDSFSGPIYFQDDTAGLAVFSDKTMRNREFGFTLNVSRGDSIVVTGPLTIFNNLLQIAPDNSVKEIFFDVFPESKRNPEPIPLTLKEVVSGDYESQLVLLEDVQISGHGPFVSDRNYTIEDTSGTGEIRISQFTDIPGTIRPFDPVHIVGISSRFQDIIQILPRSKSDFLPTGEAPFIITHPPYETSATASSITFTWETDGAGTSEIRYGRTSSYELGTLEDKAFKTSHAVTLDDLDPATIYNVQLRSASGRDTTRTSNYLVTTSSPEAATQEINVYFSQYVNHSLATYEHAVESYNFADHLINRINDALHSLDLAFYSIGGKVGSRIATAIAEAKHRQVDVRVIVDHNTATDSFVNTLEHHGIPVIESNTGSNNYGRRGLHHNKFAIIDYNGGEPENIWLVTSSWNATDDGTENQYQNMIEFQDVAIAGAYTMEFNQMWGSDTVTPDTSKSLFGSRKTIVNPSVFWIGDSFVQLHFSPQGATESAIINTLKKAQHSVNLGTMLITRPGITHTLFERHAHDVTIRGVMGQPGQQSSQFYHIAEFADIHALSAQKHGLLHHKYAIIDGEKTDWNGTVITGSHNWSGSANLRNDENTIIIQDSRIANLYVQEFAARYKQAGGNDAFITVASEKVETERPIQLQLEQNSPNPFNPHTEIIFRLSAESNVIIDIYDMIGRHVTRLLDEQRPEGTHRVLWDATDMASGTYIYRIQLSDGQSKVKVMTLLK